MACIVSARTALLSLVLLSLARQFAEGHSWIDCFDSNLTKIYDESASYIFGGAEGNGFCEGYAAGYQGRGRNTIGTDYTYKILKNEVEAGAPICEDVGPNAYTDWCTRMVVPPEVEIHFAYLPNGHIVKDKKAVGTQHGIYWTGQVGTSLTSTHDMIPENLLTGKTVDFDDGNCGETVDIDGNPSGRAGDGKPCIGSFAIPKGTPPGIYKMVWYWKFWLDNLEAYKDLNLARGYFGAAYTSCFEVEVTSGDGGGGGGGGTGSTPSDAKAPAEKPGSPDASMAPGSVVAADADPPTSPPLPAATPDLTPPIAEASASKGKEAQDSPPDVPPPEGATPASTNPVPEPASTNPPEEATPASTNPVPEPASTGTPEEAKPASTNPVPEPAPTDTPEEAKPDSTKPVPEPAPTNPPEEATPASTNPVPEPAPTNPVPEPASTNTPEEATPASTNPVPEADPTDTPEEAKPASTNPVPEADPTDTPEEAKPDSTKPVSESAPMDTPKEAKPASTNPPEEATPDSTKPVPEAEASASAAQIFKEPPAAPMAPPVVPKSSPEVPALPKSSDRGCRARVRSSMVID
ncbi:unnamed protein product [Peronospora effusa]|nr:unnamed protein product [Peronospora effusa]